MKYFRYAFVGFVVMQIGRSNGYTEFQSDVCALLVCILLAIVDIADTIDQKE
jgi:hypothetical protein